MATALKRPVYVSFVIEHDYPQEVLDIFRQCPEVTAVIVEDGSFGGGFKVECYIDREADREVFAKKLIDQVLSVTRSGHLHDDDWNGEGTINRDMSKWQDAWLMTVRPVPVS